MMACDRGRIQCLLDKPRLCMNYFVTHFNLSKSSLYGVRKSNV